MRKPLTTAEKVEMRALLRDLRSSDVTWLVRAALEEDGKRLRPLHRAALGGAPSRT